MEPDEAALIVRSVLAQQTGLAVGDIGPDLTLAADLGLDSLDAVELLVVIERRVGGVLQVDHAFFETVGDLEGWLCAAMAER